MSEEMHLLTAHRGQPPRGAAPYDITTRCGQSWRRQSLVEPIGAVTAFESRVTCVACKEA